MAAVWALVRARLRARRRALVGLALLVGLASGAVMSAAIGARRTDTAYARLLAVTRADDAEVELGGYGDRAFIDRLRRLPQVADLGVETTAVLAPAMLGDPREYGSGSRFISVASVDGRVGRTINRPLILAGRRPDPDHAYETGVSESVARRWRLRPGGTFRVRAVTFQQLGDVFSGKQVVPAGPAVALKVVAVQRLPDDPAMAVSGTEGFVSLTPAFYRTYKDKVANLPSVRVHLKRGQADLASFAAATNRLTGGSPEITVVPRADLSHLVEDAIRAQAIALVLFAALAGAAALVVVGHTLTRELSLASAGQETVRALGASRGHLLAATLVPIGLVGAAGAVLGAGVAVLASPLTPIGVALKAEPTPGLSVNSAGLAIGMAATLVLVLGRVAGPAWRLAGERPHRPGVPAAGTTSALADTAARAGLPPTSVTGLRMALEQGRGPRAVPVRASLVGVTAGIVALTAALTFGASLDRLLDSPRLYGWNFDAAAAAPDWRLGDPATFRPAWLTANPLVGAWSAVWFADVKVEGTVVNAAGFDTAGGRVFPTLVEGREPGGPDELVLGSPTLRRLGLRIGQTVQVEAGRQAAMRIVGRSALVHTDSEDAGEGVILTIDGLRRLRPQQGSGYGMVYLRFAPGTDPEAAVRSLRRLPSGAVQAVDRPQPPPNVANLSRVGALPDVLAGLLALLAASALAHLLVTSVRRRRHDLAILKALGFVRRQVSAAVAWQATTVALLALAVGLPLGVALGRWSWSLLVDRIGVGAPPVTPGPALLAGVAGTVLVANLVAAWPGRVAARTRPAVALRSE